MKLLFDQNISFRVIKEISKIYPEAKQVRELKLENFSDLKIWEFAKKNDFTIVTFDGDFYEISNIKGHPPKIIWLRIGNTTTANIVKLFTEKSGLIEDFIKNPDFDEIACIEID